MKDKRVFKALIPVEIEDGKFEAQEKEFAVVRPSLQLLNEANKLRSKLFTQLFESGTMLRQQVDTHLKDRNIWNEKLQAEYDAVQSEVIEKTQRLERGGIKLSEARDLAIEISEQRQQLVSMLVDRSDIDNLTCEGQADNERFNFLFANCLVYNDTEEKVYPDGLEGYMKNTSTDVAVKGATEFYYLMSNSESLDDQLPENRFLKKFNFVDDDMRFLERGTDRLITKEGKYIDENGFYIAYNDDGTTYHVDTDGNQVEDRVSSEDEPLPFLDDDGNPLDAEGNPVVLEEKPKPKRKRRTKKVEVAETTEADA
tara:strand:+ start:2393 stop:3328 length:936 start_codon:yes stop_codon:yes gene_type:complete